MSPVCEKYENLLMIGETLYLCGCGGIGRRAGFRFQWATVGVQVSSSAPRKEPILGTKYWFFSILKKHLKLLLQVDAGFLNIRA